MLFVFLAKTLHGTEDRKRCTLSKSAKSHALNHFGKLFQLVKIRHLPIACYNLLQDLQHALGTLTAWNAFSTALPLGKAHEETGNFYHTGILIHDNKTA